MSPDPAVDEPSARYDLGVLFVHGIGARRRGETLVEFGQPLYRWLEGACEALQDRWLRWGLSLASVKALSDQIAARDTGDSEALTWALQTLHNLRHELELADKDKSRQPNSSSSHEVSEWLGDSAIAVGVALTEKSGELPDGSPAHRELIFRRLGIDGSVTEERWLLMESGWSETFSTPRFRDLAGWGLRIIPWTIGSHFGAGLRRAWLERREVATRLQRVLWLGRVSAAALRLLGSLVLSLGAFVALAVLLLFAVLPIPRLRDAIGRLQRQIASALGDSYVLVTRPFEAAAIVGQVSRDLDRLAAPSLCGRLAVVAHGQGAAVVHEALRRRRPRHLRLLLTFGSGLRKLEEMRELLRKGNELGLAGGLTLLALVLTALSAWGLTLASRDSIFPLGVCLLWATGLLAAGLWDLVAGIDLDGLRWHVQRLAEAGIRWVDCYATRDPVPNGRILDPPVRVRDAQGEVAELPISRVVHNEGSTRRDPASYWENLDQFVLLVVSELSEAAGKGPSSVLGSALKLRPRMADAWFRHRRWRVRWLSVVRWSAALSVVLAVVAERARIGALARWGLLRTEEWLRQAVPFLSPESGGSGPMPAVHSPFFFRLGVILFAFGFSRWLWSRWNRSEMSVVLQWRIPSPGMPPLLLLAMAGQWIPLFLLFGRSFGVLIGSSLLAVYFVLFLLEPPYEWIDSAGESPEWRSPRVVLASGTALGCGLWIVAVLGFLQGIPWLLKGIFPGRPAFGCGWMVAALLALGGMSLALRKGAFAIRQKIRRRLYPQSID